MDRNALNFTEDMENTLQENQILAQTDKISEEQLSTFTNGLENLKIFQYYIFNPQLFNSYQNNYKIYTATLCGLYNHDEKSLRYKGKISRIGFITEGTKIIGTINKCDFSSLEDTRSNFVPFLSIDKDANIYDDKPVTLLNLSSRDKYFSKNSGTIISSSSNSSVVCKPTDLSIMTDYVVSVIERYDSRGNTQKYYLINNRIVPDLNRFFQNKEQEEK